MKKIIILILFLFLSCCANEESICSISEEQKNYTTFPNESEFSESSKLTKDYPNTSSKSIDSEDETLEKLLEIYLFSENYIDDIVKSGYMYYDTEQAHGYNNLLSFAKHFPNDKNGIFYVAEFKTFWTIYKIYYSEKTNSWVFIEYSDKITQIEISEIKIYENRISFYFNDETKKVFYEKGSELGHPINNCSHPNDAHFIDGAIMNYIKSEKFQKRYNETHSETFIDLHTYHTKLLYSEEEKCLLNIYHYIDYYGLTYDDFILVYGSDENINKIWGNADIIGYFSNNK